MLFRSRRHSATAFFLEHIMTYTDHIKSVQKFDRRLPAAQTRTICGALALLFMAQFFTVLAAFYTQRPDTTAQRQLVDECHVGYSVRSAMQEPVAGACQRLPNGHKQRV
jgi:hypothetical protein